MRLAVTAFLAAAGAAAACAQDSEVERRSAVVRVVERVGPAVVNIATERIVRRRVGGFMRFGDDLFDRAFEDFFSRRPRYRDQVQKSLGSGVIFDAKGHCLTNEHVVRRASAITVRLADGRSFPAKAVAVDPDHDLAILKIETTEKLPRAEFQAGDKLYVGETVIAIGNPFGLENSVTTGVVSGAGRDITGAAAASFEGLIQTDAAINPGNSGGPLLSIDGRIIGINTAIQADAEGIGFATPAPKVKVFIRRALPGPGDIPELGFGVERTGDGRLRVSWAEEAGPLRPGDVVTAVGGREVGSALEFRARLKASPKRSVRCTVARDGGTVAVELDLTHMIDSVPVTWRGLTLERVSPQVVARLGLPSSSGVLVGSVRRGSAGARSGLAAGDVVRQVNRRPVGNLGEMRSALRALGTGDALIVFVRRGQLYYAIVSE